MANSFLAYPSRPPEVGATINAALEILRTKHGQSDIKSWEQNDIAGRLIIDPILEQIEGASFVFADITRLNFNVTYEIGYAIGKQKRIILLRNNSLRSADELIQKVGIFDTLGYEKYYESKTLSQLLINKKDRRPLNFDVSDFNHASPVYVLLPRYRTDFEVHILSKIKKSRIQFRTFDPEEQGRLSALIAVNEVA